MINLVIATLIIGALVGIALYDLAGRLSDWSIRRKRTRALRRNRADLRRALRR